LFRNLFSDYTTATLHVFCIGGYVQLLKLEHFVNAFTNGPGFLLAGLSNDGKTTSPQGAKARRLGTTFECVGPKWLARHQLKCHARDSLWRISNP
jgi:hypothetical protein